MLRTPLEKRVGPAYTWPHIHPSRSLRPDPSGGTVPLSEEELRLLEQMERALVEEDPKFASTLRGTSFRRSARRRAIVSGIVFVLGIGMLMAGVMSSDQRLGFAIGIAGFVVMLGSATVALSAIRGQQQASAVPDPRTAMHPSRGFTVIDGGRTGKIRRKGRTARTSATFMERVEERW